MKNRGRGITSFGSQWRVSEKILDMENFLPLA